MGWASIPPEWSFLPVQQPAEKTPFLKYFYSNCMPRLLAPLMAQTSEDSISKGNQPLLVLLYHRADIMPATPPYLLILSNHFTFSSNCTISSHLLCPFLLFLLSFLLPFLSLSLSCLPWPPFSIHHLFLDTNSSLILL